METDGRRASLASTSKGRRFEPCTAHQINEEAGLAPAFFCWRARITGGTMPLMQLAELPLRLLPVTGHRASGSTVCAPPALRGLTAVFFAAAFTGTFLAPLPAGAEKAVKFNLCVKAN